MKAIFIDASGLGDFILRESNFGVLLLRDCIRERGKNKSKTVVKTYHADFTFDEIRSDLANETPGKDGNFIIGNEQVEAPQLNASFSTAYEREQWLKSAFTLLEELET